jgi:tryptophanyl-tRNA synthetase
MQILSSLSNERPMAEIEAEFAGKGYGEFKRAVADAVCAKLEEIQTKYNEVLTSGAIDRALGQGAERANEIADEKLAKVQKAIGMEILTK